MRGFLEAIVLNELRIRLADTTHQSITMPHIYPNEEFFFLMLQKKIIEKY